MRLYELRSASAGTQPAEAYNNLVRAVDLANRFLHRSSYASIFPAERATLMLSHSDILVDYQGEGIRPLVVEVPGWGDYRTVMGDQTHPTEYGFMSARVTGERATGEDQYDIEFLHLGPVDMAAVLLRQATQFREMDARGGFDFWINYDLLGLWPAHGYKQDNPVLERSYAVEYAFRKWLAEEHGGELPPPPPGMLEAPPDQEQRRPNRDPSASS